jgi:hypothetical protein
VCARFRFNDLKEAAAFAANAGPMEIEWREAPVVEVHRGGATEHSRRHDTLGSWLLRKNVANRVRNLAGKRGLGYAQPSCHTPVMLFLAEPSRNI